MSGGVRCVVARSVARPTLLEVLVRHGLAREPIEQALRRLGGGPGARSNAFGERRSAVGRAAGQGSGRAVRTSYEPLTDYRVHRQFYESISVKLMQRHPFVPMGERRF